VDEYLANLVLEDRARAERHNTEAVLLRRLQSGPSVEMTDADFDQIRRRVRAEIERRRSQ
jgi:hypothetical protein